MVYEQCQHMHKGSVHIQHCCELDMRMSTDRPIAISEKFVLDNNDVTQNRYCFSFWVEYFKIVYFVLTFYIPHNHAVHRHQTQLCKYYSSNITTESQSEESLKAAVDSSNYR